MISFTHNPTKYKRLIKILVWIPVINVLATLATNHNLGFGSFHLGYLRGMFLTIVGTFVFFSIKKQNKFFIITLLLTVYTFMMCLLSSNIVQSLIVWNKFYIATTLFIVGFYTVNSLTDYKSILKNSFIAAIIVMIYILLSNLLGFGEFSYGTEVLQFGETGVNILKIIGITLIVTPLAIYLYTKKRKWILVISIISIILILLGMKRGLILAVLVGFSTFLLLTPYKGKYLMTIPIFILLLIPSLFYFQDSIASVYETRVSRLGGEQLIKTGQQGEDAEGRSIELRWVLNRFSQGEIPFKLFGEDPFLARNNALGIRGHSRMNHIDFTSALDSFGLIGFLLITSWYTNILRYLFFLRNKAKIKIHKELLAFCFALFIAHIPFSISGTFTGIDLRGLLLLHLGGLIALIVKNVNLEKMNSPSKY